MKVDLIRSGTWLGDDYEDVNNVLQETIAEFVEEDDRIINIECKTESSGLSRFWIYTTKS